MVSLDGRRSRAPRVPSALVSPYRTPAPAPRWRLTPKRAALIVAGLAGFVALVWIVRLLGQVFEAWQVG